MHFWQNDRGLLRAAVVTRGWKGHRRVSTECFDNKNILAATFRSRAWYSTNCDILTQGGRGIIIHTADKCPVFQKVELIFKKKTRENSLRKQTG